MMMTKSMNKQKQLDGVRMGKSSYLDFIRDKFIYFFFIISWQPKFQHFVEIRVKQSMASVGRENLAIDINFLQMIGTPTPFHRYFLAI